MKRAVVTGLCVTIGNAVDAAENQFLRRTRIEGPSAPIGGSADGGSSHASKEMENLWETAASAANLEWDVERLLQWSPSSESGDMSMPIRPPAGPGPGPMPTIPPAFFPTPPPAPLPPQPPQPTLPGDCLQGRTREEYIFDLLSSVTDGALLNDPSSPQGRAFDYLASEDPYLEDPCVASTVEQRYGLTTFYYAMGGDAWNNSQGWLGQDQECLWFGINCLGGNPNIVTNVTLSENNLVGSIPDEIKTLEMLERIDLYSNQITGTLPTTIASLNRLILLDVEQNLLTGQAFSSQVLALPSLLAYRASNNALTGKIPPEIGGLSLLEQLWLASNVLTGSIPAEIGACTELQYIFLYDNSLTGSLPGTLGTLTNLEDLRLQENTISGTIPVELFGATSLEALRLDLNFLSGTLPTNIGTLTLLTDFRIDTNGLSGTLPSQVGALTLLENLILNNNFLTGEIPNVFGQMQSLDYMDASNNLFSGSLPKTIFDAAAIRLLYLSNNTLSGSIPSEYSKPSLLRDLYLDGNGLVGPIPNITSGQLPNLNEFLVQFNFLSGSMPATICALRTSGDLENLFSDCGGQDPEIECDFPGCCNRCFEGGSVATRRRE